MNPVGGDLLDLARRRLGSVAAPGSTYPVITVPYAASPMVRLTRLPNRHKARSIVADLVAWSGLGLVGEPSPAGDGGTRVPGWLPTNCRRVDLETT